MLESLLLMHPDKFEDFYNKYGEYNILFDRINIPSFSIAYSWQKTKRKIYNLGKVVIEDKLKDKQEVKVLDIGCGDGGDIFRWAFSFKNKNVEFFGLELSDPFVRFAKEVVKKKNLENCSFEKMDVEKDGIKGKFDLVLVSEVLEHLKDPKALLERINSILNKSGYIIISTPNSNNLVKYPFLLLKNIISKSNTKGATQTLAYEDKHFKTEEQHISVLSTAKLEKMLQESDFKDLKFFRGSVTFGGEWFDTKPHLYSFIVLFDKILDIIPIKQTSWDLIYLARKG